MYDIILLRLRTTALEEAPGVIPYASYPSYYSYDVDYPIQIHTKSLHEKRAAPTVENQNHIPWYYINKKNDDLSRIAMRILKKRSSHNNNYEI